MKVLDARERELFEGEVERTCGVQSYLREYVLVMAGQDRVRACTVEAVEVAHRLKKIVAVGVYVAKWRRWGITLTIEGSHLLKGVRTTNTVELSREQALRWMNGAPVELKDWSGAKIVLGVYKGFFLGSAIVSRNGTAYPQIPKWRRIHEE